MKKINVKRVAKNFVKGTAKGFLNPTNVGLSAAVGVGCGYIDKDVDSGIQAGAAALTTFAVMDGIINAVVDPEGQAEEIIKEYQEYVDKKVFNNEEA